MRTAAILVFATLAACATGDDTTTLVPGDGKGDGATLAEVRLTPRNPRQAFKVISNEYVSSDLVLRLAPFWPATKVSVTARRTGAHAEFVLTDAPCVKNGQATHYPALLADGETVAPNLACDELPPAHLESSAAIDTFNIVVEKTSFDVDEVTYSLYASWY